jgi:hypothetical protein
MAYAERSMTSRKRKQKQAAAEASAERMLDAAVEMTFPASDPIAVEHAYKSAIESKDGEAPDEEPAA